MCKSKTQQAKDLYDILRQIDVLDIMFEGLMGDAVWISSGRRAYRLDELSDGHLSNIILKYLKNEEEVPSCISREQNRRRELASKP